MLVSHRIFFGGARIARRDASGNVYYYFADHLGSSRTITNSAGALCYEADLYPFGGERVITNTCGQNYKFAGMQRDSETGNDHTWFRHYASTLGRWLSPDTVAGSIFNPQSLNRYAYVLNSPTNLIDPLGLQGGPPPHLPACTTMECAWQYYGGSLYFGYIGYTNTCTIDGVRGPCASVYALLQSGAAGIAPPGSSTIGMMNGQGFIRTLTDDGWQLSYPGLSARDIEALGLPTSELASDYGSLPHYSGFNSGFGSPNAPPLRTLWKMAKAGYYWNPIDQAVNPFHEGEWSFREVFGTVCSSHATVNKATGEIAGTHLDTVNPVPGWMLLVPAVAPLWGATFTAHLGLDVAGIYPASEACR